MECFQNRCIVEPTSSLGEATCFGYIDNPSKEGWTASIVTLYPLPFQDTGKVIKHTAEERIGGVTVLDVVIDFIDQLINIENNEVFVEVS